MRTINIEIEPNELHLIFDALRFKIRHLEEDRFYRHREPDGYYLCNIEERIRLLDKISNIPIPIDKYKQIKFRSQKPKN